MAATLNPERSAKGRVFWRLLAAASGLAPEVALPLRSYLLYGYLTGEATLIVTVLLPCAILAFAATVHEARPLWSEGPHQDAVVLVGMTTLGLLLAGAATNAAWSGMASCYECGMGWFFFFALPAFLLEFLTGAIWILLVHGSLHRVSTPVRSQ